MRCLYVYKMKGKMKRIKIENFQFDKYCFYNIIIHKAELIDFKIKREES